MGDTKYVKTKYDCRHCKHHRIEHVKDKECTIIDCDCQEFT